MTKAPAILIALPTLKEINEMINPCLYQERGANEESKLISHKHSRPSNRV